MSYWKAADVALLHEMQANGKTQREIAKVLKRSMSSVYYQVHRDFFHKRNRKAYRDYKALRLTSGFVSRVDVPQQVKDERDRRINEYRTPSQELFGDPPFSQSALGRRDALVSAKTES